MSNILHKKFIYCALSIILLGGVFLWCGVARAQTEEIFGLGLDEFSAPSVELIVSSSGTLGSAASIAAKTTNINDTDVSFDWYLDDQLIFAQSGRAKTSFSFTTSRSFHMVRLSIIESGKKIAESATPISSFNVSLIWRTNTFIPSDYEGKPLPIVGSTITLTAFPDIKGEEPENLLYTWSINAESQVRNVLGEQEFSFMAMRNVSSVFVSVKVSTLNQSSSITKALNIPLARPQVVLPSTLPTFLDSGTRIDILAQPYYFNVAMPADLQYEWVFSGKKTVGIPPDPNALTLIIPEASGKGAQTLTVSAENRRAPGEKGQSSAKIIVL